jgi:hypothetical protein
MHSHLIDLNHILRIFLSIPRRRDARDALTRPMRVTVTSMETSPVGRPYSETYNQQPRIVFALQFPQKTGLTDIVASAALLSADLLCNVSETLI